jgi:transcriptional regulator
MIEESDTTVQNDDEDETSDFVRPGELPAKSSDVGKSWGDRMIKTVGPNEVLTPRYRRIAELYAGGMRPGDIAKLLDYTKARISVILSCTRMQQEIAEIQGIEFTEPIKTRIKKFGAMAMDNIEQTLRGGGGVSPSVKNETSKWVFEQIEGKPQQKVDIGENLLGILVDKFDAADKAGKFIDVTPKESADPAKRELLGQPEEVPERTERDGLDDWLGENK